MTPADRIHDRLLQDQRVAAQFTDRTQLQRMLDVEAALADSEAAVGVVPMRCVSSIRAAARAELYDLTVIAAEAVRDGNPAIPVVRHLTDRVAMTDADAARYVHWGATSQDILDTALVLQLGSSVPIVVEQVERASSAAAVLARRYGDTVMAGRTWLQQATPITFGLKAAGWVDGLERARARLNTALDGVLVLQFGGASGTLASLGAKGTAVADALAERLNLRVPEIPWHSQRDRLADLACALGIATATGGKIARDISLLAQSEVGEVSEKREDGRGVSSTMPQKRNPVASSVALAAAGRAPGLVATMLGAMVQEHERGLGSWQAEWDTIPDLVLVSAGGARGVADALDGLVVYPERMAANMEVGGGTLLAESVAMALAEHVGKHDAHVRVDAACQRARAERRSLADVLAEDPLVSGHLDRAEVEHRLSPENYLGATRTFIERVLAVRGQVDPEE